MAKPRWLPRAIVLSHAAHSRTCTRMNTMLPTEGRRDLERKKKRGDCESGQGNLLDESNPIIERMTRTCIAYCSNSPAFAFCFDTVRSPWPIDISKLNCTRFSGRMGNWSWGVEVEGVKKREQRDINTSTEIAIGTCVLYWAGSFLF